jgi:hypothetical protein
VPFRYSADDIPQPLRGDGKLGDGAGDADGVIDRGADAIDPGFACAFEAERVERARRVLGHEHFERRDLAGGGDKIIGEGAAERLAPLVVQEFLEQRAAEPLREATGHLAFDQHRIDRPPDVVGSEIALDRDPSVSRSTRTTAICTP